LPGSKDFAALPTSWALTLWDALPLFLSVEVALAVALVALTAGETKRKLWSWTRVYPLGAILYAALFDIRLSVLLATILAGRIAFRSRGSSNYADVPTPHTPLESIRLRGGSVIADVAKAAAIGAIVKIVLSPEIAPGASSWFIVAITGGLVAPGPLGVAAIPALSIRSASDSILVAALWLLAAALRPFILSRLSRWRQSRQTAASH
jgi:hypothetical protein